MFKAGTCTPASEGKINTNMTNVNLNAYEIVIHLSFAVKECFLFTVMAL
jgi:hypothetical protein